MAAHDDLMSLFLTIGLSEHKVKETLKNDMLTEHLKCVIEEVRRSNCYTCQVYSSDLPWQTPTDLIGWFRQYCIISHKQCEIFSHVMYICYQLHQIVKCDASRSRVYENTGLFFCTRWSPYTRSYLEFLQISVREVTCYAEVVTVVHASETQDTHVFLT
jgi:hypothetical protein